MHRWKDRERPQQMHYFHLFVKSYLNLKSQSFLTMKKKYGQQTGLEIFRSQLLKCRNNTVCMRLSCFSPSELILFLFISQSVIYMLLFLSSKACPVSLTCNRESENSPIKTGSHSVSHWRGCDYTPFSISCEAPVE